LNGVSFSVNQSPGSAGGIEKSFSFKRTKKERVAYKCEEKPLERQPVANAEEKPLERQPVTNVGVCYNAFRRTW
jgi:hypothetical protein